MPLARFHSSSLCILGFEGTRLPDPLRARLSEGGAAGVILFSRNIASPIETARLVAEIGAAVPADDPPPIVSVDQEGGRVQRLRGPLTRWPAMLRVAESGDLALTESVGRALGAELRLLGFNVDYAPVFDVLTNPINPVIGDRAFGTRPADAALQACAFLRGLESSSVRGCAKHFPGHGDTAIDSHLDLPFVDRPLESLRAVELPPFAAAVRAGIGMIMTAHIVLPALDALPATMSAAWIDGVLRGELGYGGVVVSDDLDMKAVAGRYPVEEVIFEALRAGVDAFLLCRDPARQEEADRALARAALDPVLGPRMRASAERLRAFRQTLAPARPASDEAIEAAFSGATGATASSDGPHAALAARWLGGAPML